MINNKELFYNFLKYMAFITFPFNPYKKSTKDPWDLYVERCTISKKENKDGQKRLY